MGALLASWKTSVLGVLVLICGGTSFSGVLPEKYNALLMFGCSALTAFGLINAKDGNVSNSPIPAAAKVVSDTNEARKNPA